MKIGIHAILAASLATGHWLSLIQTRKSLLSALLRSRRLNVSPKCPPLSFPMLPAGANRSNSLYGRLFISGGHADALMELVACVVVAVVVVVVVVLVVVIFS